MALSKSVENNQGVAFSYWRVMPYISVDFAEGTARAHLRVWANQTARQNGKQPLDVADFTDTQPLDPALNLSGEDFTAALATGDLRAAIYGQLKALDFFAGAEDILEED